MNIAAKKIKMLEYEIMSLRVALEQVRSEKNKPTKDRSKLLDLFGTWEGEIDTVLQDFYARRERRGRLE